uniref:Apyrase 6 n=1 Tax=Nelumbo nucifera TaxID=4432 RepID=A0A822YCG4_NELNU|nr:TPA_asm: hypothetical protein HUJ06_030679 [Nelumbo nucifera]
MDFSNLQSRASSAYIPPHRTQLHPRMHSFSSFASPNPKPSQPRDRWWVLLAAVLIVPFLFYLFAIARGIHKSSKFDEWRPKGFGVIINAGSTGSTIHVFEFLNEGRIPFVGYDGKGSNSMKVRPGLSEFRDDPGRAGSSILSLVEFAKARVPKSEWKKTKVRLMGTGDLGRLDMDVRKAILESCRLVLRSSGFLFKDEWASVITGQEEGVYAWVAANYALGTLGGDPKETTGIIQLAEGSIQVTFSPRGSLPIQFSRVIELVGVTYNLYSESTFHFGQDEAWASVLGLHSSQDLGSFLSSSEGIMKNPCIPKGYSQKLNQAEINTSDGKQLASQLAGNFSACRSEALALLQKGKDECFHPPCKIVSSFLPKILGNTVPPDTFYYTSEVCKKQQNLEFLIYFVG